MDHVFANNGIEDKKIIIPPSSPHPLSAEFVEYTGGGLEGTSEIGTHLCQVFGERVLPRKKILKTETNIQDGWCIQNH